MRKPITKLYLIIIILAVLVVSSCSFGIAPSSTNADPIEPTIPSHIIKLSPDTINTAVAECKNEPNWGINLGKVRINYLPGANVEAALILHNGNDAERYVKLSYSPIYKPNLDGETGITYYPAPIEASGWVTIETDTFRLDKMQTEVVPIQLLVPADYTTLPEYWEFQILANGSPIMQYQYNLIVTTADPTITEGGEVIHDTKLEQHLPLPPLHNSLGSIQQIISSIAEIPYATNYNPVTGILTVEGLKESAVRNLTIIYETVGIENEEGKYGNPIVIGYNQRWLIHMIQ